MQSTTLLLVLAIMAFAAYQIGMRRSVSLVQGKTSELHSLASYYGYFSALWGFIPAFFIFILWLFAEESVLTAIIQTKLSVNCKKICSSMTFEIW